MRSCRSFVLFFVLPRAGCVAVRPDCEPAALDHPLASRCLLEGARTGPRPLHFGPQDKVDSGLPCFSCFGCAANPWLIKYAIKG